MDGHKEYAEKAEKLIGDIRVHGSGDGPAYGDLKAQAAQTYALLAICERLDALMERMDGQGR